MLHWLVKSLINSGLSQYIKAFAVDRPLLEVYVQSTSEKVGLFANIYSKRLLKNGYLLDEYVVWNFVVLNVVYILYLRSSLEQFYKFFVIPRFGLQILNLLFFEIRMLKNLWYGISLGKGRFVEQRECSGLLTNFEFVLRSDRSDQNLYFQRILFQ